jgi:hypothetical protein
MPKKSSKKSNRNKKEEIIPEDQFMKQLRSGGDMKWINTINIALAVYQTDIGFYAINNYLRKNPFGSNHIIKLIDKGMNNKQKGIQVFRGVRPSENFKIEPLKSYGEYGYSSVSPNFCSAVKFSNRENCCVLSFEITNDILSYDYKNSLYAFHSDEEEILIQRNIVYHIGEPVIINEMLFYPCVVTKMDNSDKLKKLIDKQTKSITKFRDIDYNKTKSGSAEEILDNLEKNNPYPYSPLLVNLDLYYNNLCLDKKMYKEVEKLAKDKYGK